MKGHLFIVYIVSLVIGLFSITGFLPADVQNPPESAMISGLVGHGQTYGLSCESRSATDVSAFWGITTDEKTLLELMPRSDDPEIGFVGDIDDPWGYVPPQSYGVHAEPIADVLRQSGLNASARVGMTWVELQDEITRGRPVIVWVVGAVWNGTPILYTTQAGRQVIVAAFEHTMIMIGYDRENVTLVNAGDGKTGTYPISDFQTSWKVLNQMAVTVNGKFGYEERDTLVPPIISPTHDQSPSSTEISSTQIPLPSIQVEDILYIVQPGETLSDIADMYDITWQILAEYNQIDPPYSLFSGQEIRIPPVMNRIDTTPQPRREPTTTATPSLQAPTLTLTSYTVEKGDTLARLARRWGIKWSDIASTNQLLYPYVLTPGQVLYIPHK